MLYHHDVKGEENCKHDTGNIESQGEVSTPAPPGHSVYTALRECF